jgi:acyl-coenzyme A synthetase/AMP-(fatty) acid ligase
VYSSEVENHLLFHPGIIEAAVVGRPCSVLGERVHAYIRPVASVADEDMLKLVADWCAGRLSDYKIPESVTLVSDPLPRNVNGKTMKMELRNRLRLETAVKPGNA